MTVVWNTDPDMTPSQASDEKAAQARVMWAVRDALRAAGPDGLTTADLYAICPSAVRRLNDLRHEHGYDYRRTYAGARTWRYVLIEPGQSTRPERRVIDRAVSEAARILAKARRPRPVMPSLF